MQNVSQIYDFHGNDKYFWGILSLRRFYLIRWACGGCRRLPKKSALRFMAARRSVFLFVICRDCVSILIFYLPIEDRDTYINHIAEAPERIQTFVTST